MYKQIRIVAVLSMAILFAAGCGKKEAIDTSVERVKLIAVKDFTAVAGEPQRWYEDKERNCLAVDAAKFKDQFAKVETLFAGKSGYYNVSLAALTEIDGESQYRIIINDRAFDIKNNPESDDDFITYEHLWENIKINQGDKIAVEFNAVTNGKIPEHDITAYSRGRWTELTLTLQQ